jgi:hypothetical protein
MAFEKDLVIFLLKASGDPREKPVTAVGQTETGGFSMTGKCYSRSWCEGMTVLAPPHADL